MDILTKMAMEHGQVYESLTIFKHLIEIDRVQDSYPKLKDFFRDIIGPHFKYEEDHVFGIMAKRGTTEEKCLTQQLIDEHEKIFAVFGRFTAAYDKALADGIGDTPEFREMVADIARMLVDHSHKEDKSFYPNLKKYLL